MAAARARSAPGRTGRRGPLSRLCSVQTLQADDCQFILPCNGDRVFGMAQDHEMTFTMPRSKADEVLKGLEATHKAGQRYPVPTFMRFQPDMPGPYNKMMEYPREGAAERSPSPRSDL
ncbi:MAG: DUF169 domain-containing protein [Candidatus Methylomirabilia bacterium]